MFCSKLPNCAYAGRAADNNAMVIIKGRIFTICSRLIDKIDGYYIIGVAVNSKDRNEQVRKICN